MEKKKIAIIGAKGLPAHDGISRVVENYIDYLTDKYDFTIFCTSEFTQRDNGIYDGYEQVVIKKVNNKRLNTLIYYIKSVWIILFNRKFDLIHFHHCDSAFLFPLVRIKYKNNLLVTTHGAFTELNDKWKKYEWYFHMQYKWFLRCAPHLTCVSKNEQKKTLQNINKKSIYIPNGINIYEKVKNDCLESDYIFFAAGRIMEIKGLDIMLQALNHINYKGHIKIAGDFSQSSLQYKSKIEKLSQTLNIEILGMIKEKSLLYGYIKNCKMFIFPSNTETMSMQLLEAAALKVPIIASDIIENTDIFNDEEVLFFRKGDYLDLSEKIIFALCNSEKMKIMANKAYKTLKENYTWDMISQKYNKVYNFLLDK